VSGPSAGARGIVGGRRVQNDVHQLANVSNRSRLDVEFGDGDKNSNNGGGRDVHSGNTTAVFHRLHLISTQ
jgi:hypothetical protein